MKTIVVIVTLLTLSGIRMKPETTIDRMKNKYVQPSVELKTGDLVFRSGKGLISEMFMKTSQHEQKFSHAGVVVIENDQTYVVHMIGSSISRRSGFIKETMESFCNSEINYGYMVTRLMCLENRKTCIESWVTRIKQKLPVFDENFDLATDSELYCTEMIYKMVKEVGGINLPLSTLNDQPFMPVDNLYLNTQSIHLTEQQY